MSFSALLFGPSLRLYGEEKEDHTGESVSKPPPQHHRHQEEEEEDPESSDDRRDQSEKGGEPGRVARSDRRQTGGTEASSEATKKRRQEADVDADGNQGREDDGVEGEEEDIFNVEAYAGQEEEDKALDEALDEDEEADEEKKAELRDLQEEATLPIEELLRRYLVHLCHFLFVSYSFQCKDESQREPRVSLSVSEETSVLTLSCKL